MTASLVRRSVMGIASAVDLQNYGFMMTKTIGKPLLACGIFCLAPAEINDLERRYHGLADAINAARSSLHGSYCKPSGMGSDRVSSYLETRSDPHSFFTYTRE